MASLTMCSLKLNDPAPQAFFSSLAFDCVILLFRTLPQKKIVPKESLLWVQPEPDLCIDPIAAYG